MNILEVIPNIEYVLHIKMEDGRTGWFDVRPYLKSEAFSPLKDKEEFKRVHNGKYFVEWACGADLSADTIDSQLNPLPIHNTQKDIAE